MSSHYIINSVKILEYLNRKIGKIRLLPRAPRLTALKRLILKQRAERRVQYVKEAQRTELYGSSDAGDKVITDRADAAAEQEKTAAEQTKTDSTSATDEFVQRAKQCIHNRKFREYCNQLISKDICRLAYSMIKELFKFQHRAMANDPLKVYHFTCLFRTFLKVKIFH